MSDRAANSSGPRAGTAGPSASSFLHRLVRGSRWTWIDDLLSPPRCPPTSTSPVRPRAPGSVPPAQGRSTGAGRLSCRFRSALRLFETSLPAPLALPPGGHDQPRGRILLESRRVAASEPRPRPGDRGSGGGRRRRADRAVGPSAELPDDRRPGRQRAPARGDPRRWARRLDLARVRGLEASRRRPLADITATLHRASLFHKDLYLCHFFMDGGSNADPLPDAGNVRLTLIDLHRLGHQLAWPFGGRKDLGELLFSTYGVEGIDDRDRLRFWSRYRRQRGLFWPGWHARMIVWKAARYRAHGLNRERPRLKSGSTDSRLPSPSAARPCSRGGAETYVADLCRGLVAPGVDLYAESWARGAVPEGVNVAPGRRRQTRLGRTRSFARNSEERARGRLDHDRADQHPAPRRDHQGGIHRGSLAANARRFPRWPRRPSQQEGEPSAPSTRRSRSCSHRAQAKVIAVSNLVKEHLL